MTFIDKDSKAPSPLQVILFAIASFLFMICGIWAFVRAHSRRHYKRVYVVRFLLPINCLFNSIENIYLAVSSFFIKNEQESLSLHPLLQTLFVLQSVQVPIYLVTIFELTYLIHKRRSVHFLGMYFDEGRLGRTVKGVFSTPFKSFLARNFIRMLSTLLFVINVIVDFNLLPQLQTVGDLAGKTGWVTVFDSDQGGTKHDVLLSLVPISILILCSFVLSTTLWRYGTSTSMIVHSSFMNPWFAPFFGTLALLIGYLVPGWWFPLTSNASQLVYTITLLFLIREIDRDITAFAEFTDFLHQVAKKGNQITVHNVLASPERPSSSGHSIGVPLPPELNEGVDNIA